MAHNAALVVLVFAIWIVTFWRTVLKFAAYIAVTAIIAGLGYSALVAWHNMHQIIR